MNILNKLTKKNLTLNKKRTIVTIIGIILSTALICAVTSMYASAISSLIEFETAEKGNFHYAFYNVPVDDIEDFYHNRKIEKVNITRHIGYAVLDQSKNEYKPYAHIMEFTKDSLESLSIKLVEGRMPKNENEILIPTHLKTNGRVSLEVGQTITLDVGRRINDDCELFQSNPFQKDNNERIVDTNSKTYKIVGIMERPASNIESYSAPGYTFITYFDEKNISKTVDIYARYTKDGLEDPEKLTADIIGVDATLFKKIDKGNFTKEEFDQYSKMMDSAKYKIDANYYLISLETNPLGNSSVEGLGIVVCIVCIIIIFTSVFCIKNSFDISITEKMKQYGMLRSIGATRKQIKRNVFYEAFILGLIGIPLGILLGIIASYILVVISNFFITRAFDIKFVMIFDLSYLAILFSILLGIITIYLSASKVARRASKVSPIDSIRNSADIKIKSKKLRSPKIIHTLFGVGGDISYKNLKRNKKKYRTTVVSITVSVLTFIALSSFIDLAFLSVEDELKMSDYNISLFSSSPDKEFYQKLEETTYLDNILQYTILNRGSLYISSSNYSKEYIEKSNSVINNDDNYDAFLNIYAVGEQSYKNYLEKLGLDYEKMKDKAILVDKQKIGKYDEKKRKTIYSLERVFKYQVGDSITGEINFIKDKKNFEIEVGAISDEMPFAITNESGAMIIVSDEVFNSKVKNNDQINSVNIFYNSNNPNKLQDDIEKFLSDKVSIFNIAENVSMMRNLYTLVAIFLYGFIIVISLIGITNIFNTITTNMYLRKREFATLKSIGMTNKEFSRMIRLESIFMGAKSLLFGLPIGIILSYIIYHYLSEEMGIEYPFPTMAIIISIIAVILLITSLMKYSMNKINKQNTIETIRNENI